MIWKEWRTEISFTVPAKETKGQENLDEYTD
jgi:hypothetical protein